MPVDVGDALRLYPAALGRTLARQAAAEWAGTPLHRAALRRPRPVGEAAAPRDFRPVDGIGGAAILAGAFDLTGTKLVVGPRGDPWDRASPSRRFAVALHRFDWLPGLLDQGEEGRREAARLVEAWSRQFGAWNAFSWAPEVLERRVFALACGLNPLGLQSPAQASALRESLAAQARALLASASTAARPAERTLAAAVAGAALDFGGGADLLSAALRRLPAALSRSVRPDGGHASRAPSAGLELLLDLRTLQDALRQRGATLPDAVAEAAERLAAAVRFFIGPDGRLAAFQGGEPSAPARVQAALLPWSAVSAAEDLPDSRYHRLQAGELTLLVDAGAPAYGAVGAAAAAQPGAIEVWAAGEPLIVGGGWSAEALAPPALRLSAAASTATVGGASPGEPLTGRLARALGPRLRGAPRRVRAELRREGRAQWLELSHDGWRRSHGVRHERRLFADAGADELRGEDAAALAPGPKAPVELAVRFHLPRGVEASVGRDGRSVLLRTPAGRGWRLRSDAAEHRVEASARVLDLRPHRTSQVVLKSVIRPSLGGRIRWKLSPVAPGEDR